MKRYLSVLPAFVVLFMGIGISFFVQFMHNEGQRNLQGNEVNIIIENKTRAIQQELSTSFSSIDILRFLFEKHQYISREEFYNYSAPLMQGNPCIKALSWVPKITFEERAGFESQMQTELISNFVITQRDKQNEAFTAKEQPFYFPVKYIEPILENYNALGYDIYSSDARKAAIHKTIDKGEFLITSRIKLVQDTSGYSFLGLIPVFFTSDSLENTAHIENVRGLISAVFKIERLINDAFVHTNDPDIDLVVFDVTNNKREYLYGDEKLLNQTSPVLDRKIQVAGREWELDFLIGPAYAKITDSWVYLAVGISIALLLFLLLLFPYLKEERNRMLFRKLLDEKKVRKVTELFLSESEEYNRALFTQSSIGLVLTTMDGKLTDVNPAFAKIIGRSVKETLRLNYWEITPDKFHDQEKQQLESLRQIKKYGPYEKEYIHKDGHLVPVRLQGKIIERKGVEYIWSGVENISEQKRGEEELTKLTRILKETGEIAKIGGWEFDVETGIGIGTEEISRIYDLDQNTSSTKEMKLSYYTPRSRELIEEAFQGAIQNKKSSKLDLELISAKGNHKWVRLIGTPVISDENVVKIRGSLQDITERKKSEISLKENEERFRTIFEQSASGMCLTGLDGRLLKVNEPFCEMLGYTIEELEGKHFNSITFPEDINIGSEAVRKMLAGEINKAVFEKRYVIKSGEPLWVHINSALLRDTDQTPQYFINQMEDISQRMIADNQLKISENKYKALVEQSLTGIYIFEKERFIYANKRFCEIFGYSEKEILNELKPTDVVATDERPKASENIDNRLSANVKSVRYTAKGNHKLGKPLWIEIHGTHIEYEGKNVIMGTVLDITDRKNAEEEIKKLNEVLELRVAQRTEELEKKSNELSENQVALLNIVEDLNEKSNLLEQNAIKLKAANNELKDFAYIVSHDLKAPLRAVSQLSYWVYNDYKDVLDEDGREQLALISSRAKRMDALIRGILEYSRIGREHIKNEKVDLEAVYTEVIHLLAPPDNISIVVKTKLPAVWGDKTRFIQIFQNLIGNSIKYMDKEKGEIEISCTRKKSDWEFSIRDNGPGIDAKYHEKIFQIFQTLHARDEIESTGIGLTLVKKIINMYSGKIWLESKEGKGTTFFFNLPNG